jgi:hypothetical protein
MLLRFAILSMDFLRRRQHLPSECISVLYFLAHTRDSLLTAVTRYTHSSLFLALNSTSALADGTRRLSACTSVDGTAARRPMVHLTT